MIFRSFQYNYQKSTATLSMLKRLKQKSTILKRMMLTLFVFSNYAATEGYRIKLAINFGLHKIKYLMADLVFLCIVYTPNIIFPETTFFLALYRIVSVRVLFSHTLHMC